MKAHLTFMYQRVYCPTAKRLVHLNPLPPEVAASHPNLDFLGADLPPETAQQIAEGMLDAMTRQPFSTAAAAGSAPAGAGGGDEKQAAATVAPEVLAAYLASAPASAATSSSSSSASAARRYAPAPQTNSLKSYFGVILPFMHLKFQPSSSAHVICTQM